MGMVPNPKKAIKLIVFREVFPEEMAADNAIYTIPQGSSPLNMPVSNKLLIVALPISLLSCFLMKSVQGSAKCVALLGKRENIPTKKRMMPAHKETYCCSWKLNRFLKWNNQYNLKS